MNLLGLSVPLTATQNESIRSKLGIDIALRSRIGGCNWSRNVRDLLGTSVICVPRTDRTVVRERTAAGVLSLLNQVQKLLVALVKICLRQHRAVHKVNEVEIVRSIGSTWSKSIDLDNGASSGSRTQDHLLSRRKTDRIGRDVNAVDLNLDMIRGQHGEVEGELGLTGGGGICDE